MMAESMLNGRMLAGGAGKNDHYNTQLLYITSSSVSENDERLYMICDKGGNPNVLVKDLLTGNKSDWLGQDAHPHPIYSHAGDRIIFNSRMDQYVNVYCVSSKNPISRKPTDRGEEER